MRGLHDPREPATFAILVLAGFVVARFLAVALHEVVGHGLTTLALGGSFYGVYISPGSGFAYVLVPRGAPVAGSAAIALAGIAVEVAVGVLLLALYRRTRTFVGALFLLLVLEVLLVYPFVYLAIGAFGGTGGDSAQAASVLGAPHLVAGFLVVGLLWAIAFAYRISRAVVHLTGPASPPRRQLLYLALFWFTPLAIATVPALSLASSVSESLLRYFLSFLVIGGGVFAAASYVASRIGPAGRVRDSRPQGRATPMAVAFALILPAWFVPFGPTDGTAHGLLLGEPPLEAEPQWATPLAVNVKAVLATDGNVSLEFRFKGVREPRSPLEARVVSSYEERAYFAYWSESAVLLASTITNVTSWSVASMGIESGGTAWIADRTVPRPRLVVLDVSRAEERARLLSESPPSFLTLVLRDPFQADPEATCRGCFLDEVNVTWPADAYVPLVIAERGGYAERLFGYDPGTGMSFVRFRNRSAEHPPSVYDLRLERLAPP